MKTVTIQKVALRWTQILALGLAALTTVHTSASAPELDSIQFWTGTGTNRAAMVIHWSAPEVRNNSTVLPPIADQSLVWGYRWNGQATGEQMLRAISAADPRLYTVINVSAFGASILGLGYDLNNNRVFGVRVGTTVLAPRSFTNGVATLSTSGVDTWQPLDPADLFWSGWTGPGWETWQEQGGSGGFTNAPDRGATLYWTPDDPSQPYSGQHGQWQLAGAGLSGTTLKDGSWLGFVVARGGLDFLNPTAPGTIAYNLHKQAPKPPTSAQVPASPFAVAVVDARGAFGASPYDDPASVLGMPSTDFYDAFGEGGGGTKERRVKIVEAPYNYDLTQTNKLITTFETNSSVIVRFDQPVTNDPAHPYGIDFLVFGNSFYSADGFVSEASDMNVVKIMGGLFGEPVKISVSPGFTGRTGEVENDPATWQWYRYENGPFGDTAFPTQGYVWNRSSTNWSAQPMDFTRPVNPALASTLDAGNLSVADAIDLYTGSGGGTGFDLAPSGFSSVRYAKIEGIAPDWVGGEIDAFAVVRPATLNESLSIGPANLTNGTSQLMFQDPANTTVNRLQLDLKSLDTISRVDVSKLNPVDFTSLIAVDLQVRSAVGGNPVSFAADAHIGLGGIYLGEGSDLNVMSWNGTNWVASAFAFNSNSNTVTLAGVTNSTSLAVVRVTSPTLVATLKGAEIEVRFQTVAGWTHVLERTTDFAQWSELNRVTTQNLEQAVLTDTASSPKSVLSSSSDSALIPGVVVGDLLIMKRQGFTLIELLVVVAIISILAALIFPALTRGKSTAQRINCLNNLRQMTVAAQIYTDDYRGFYPVAYSNEVRNGTTYSVCWDFTTSLSTPSKVEPGLLWGSQGANRIQQCPAFRGKANWSADPFTGYNYNTSFIGHGEHEAIPAPAKAADIRKPSQTLLFGDGQYSAGANKFMRAPWPNPGDQTFKGRWAGTQGFRHAGQSNAALSDGHTEAFKHRNIENQDGTSSIAPGTGFLTPDNFLYDLE